MGVSGRGMCGEGEMGGWGGCGGGGWWMLVGGGYGDRREVRLSIRRGGQRCISDGSKTPRFIEAMAAETGATAMWAGFNCMLAAGMIREAAGLTTQISGELIPSDVPGSMAMAVRQPAGVGLGLALLHI